MTVDHSDATQGSRPSRCPVGSKVVKVDTVSELSKLLRSKAVRQDPDVSADNYRVPTSLGDENVDNYLSGILAFTDGDDHRRRRKLLNSLVRPEELIKFREEVVLPSVDRWMSRMVTGPDSEGNFRCDLAPLVETIFLEFAAKIIGIIGVESEEGMAGLRSCALPMFAGMSASFFEDREPVTRAGAEAKQKFIREYYRPSYDACAESMRRLEAGELSEDDVPLNLMRFIVAAEDPSYAEPDIGVKEAALFFIATTGTSVQSVLGTISDLSTWFEAHPDDRALIEDLDFISAAFQESLRLKAPYVSYLTRLATEDLQVDSLEIRKGDEIHALVPKAGRDKSVYGPDADQFNPKRVLPEGVFPYGLAFGGGPHQCLGLRAVLGNDGKSGGHIRLLQILLRAGVQLDPDNPPVLLTMRQEDDAIDDIPTYISFPAVLTNWSPSAAATA